MKQTIEKLSRGIVEYEAPKMEVSVSTIEISVEADTTFDGEFDIVSSNDGELKGIVYSTDERLVIINENFMGMRANIKFRIFTAYVEDGQTIEGSINIVSNAGEIYIPYIIKIESKSVDTTVGKVKNLFHFTNFVQMNYDEAIKLFLSPEFSDVFLKEDFHLKAIYQTLIKGADKHIALEEFLIEANKKNKINLTLTETNKTFTNVTEETGDIVVITKDTWGYVAVHIETDIDFIRLSKKILTAEDFAGSNYEYNYYIDNTKLHDGMNYGRITFVSHYQELVYEITVDNRTPKQELRIERKDCICRLNQIYLKFRMHQYELDNWANESLALIDRIRGIDDSDYFYKLAQAHVYITKGMESEAGWLLENVAETLIEKRNAEVESYAYYLYVRAIQKRETAFTNDVLKRIKSYYENGYDSWKVLWPLLYLDSGYENNVSLKLARIKEQYAKSCRSPILYFEGLSVLNEQPELLRVLNDFEIQVLLYGAKHNYINRKLADRISELMLSTKMFKEMEFRILAYISKKYDTNDSLFSICSMLIRGNKTDNKYFEWFDKGVSSGLKITNLYEYFLYSLSTEYSKPLPQIILMYFQYNSNNLYEKQAILFDNVIRYKEQNPSIYENYYRTIERYALDEIKAGHISPALVNIYREFLEEAYITPEISNNLIKILTTFEISCSDNNIREVNIRHKEYDHEYSVPLTNGKALVNIFTENPAISFTDINGNRYVKTVQYRIVEMFQNIDDFIKMAYELSQDNVGVVLRLIEQYMQYRNINSHTIDVLKSALLMDKINTYFKSRIMNEIIEYYADNFDGDELDEYLWSLNEMPMDMNTRTRIIELMITRGLYEQAYKMIEKYGCGNIDSRKTMRLITRMIKRINFEENKTLVNLGIKSFRKGKYDETILEYLSRYYNGTTKELLSIWKAAGDFDFESRVLEEKVIVQMLFTRTYVYDLGKVFESYYNKGAGEKIKNAFLFYKSFDYFVKEKVIEDEVFTYLERDIYENMIEPDICKAAYLKHFSEEETLTKQQIEIAKRVMTELCEKNILFEFYKKYTKYFKLPSGIADKTIIEYRTKPDIKVLIHYILETGLLEHKGYAIEEMKSPFQGIYVKNFLMFYGENISYYITEEDTNELLTESQNIYKNDRSFSHEESKYGLLNDMMVCKDMGEDSTFAELAQRYITNKKLTEEFFDI